MNATIASRPSGSLTPGPRPVPYWQVPGYVHPALAPRPVSPVWWFLARWLVWMPIKWGAIVFVVVWGLSHPMLALLCLSLSVILHISEK